MPLGYKHAAVPGRRILLLGPGEGPFADEETEAGPVLKATHWQQGRLSTQHATAGAASSLTLWTYVMPNGSDLFLLRACELW